MSQLGLADDTANASYNHQNISPATKLAKCPDCAQSISYRAEVCPHCGLRFKHDVSQPSIARIALGVIVGYIGILIITAAIWFVALVVFAGAFASAFNDIRQGPTSSPRR